MVGLGQGLVRALGKTVEGLRPFPAMAGPGCAIPSTQGDLWVWLRGEDRGHIAGAARELRARFARPSAATGRSTASDSTAAWICRAMRTAPRTPRARPRSTPPSAHRRAGLDGSSFVAVQQWLHDLDHFETLARAERDNIIGRRLSDNEELDDAPASAHVKRTAQESFDPEAFLLRRSMPWGDAGGEGLMFVAFGKSFDAFEAQLARMTGQEDGITDALFRFTRPLREAISGARRWPEANWTCPPSGINFVSCGRNPVCRDMPNHERNIRLYRRWRRVRRLPGRQPAFGKSEKPGAAAGGGPGGPEYLDPHSDRLLPDHDLPLSWGYETEPDDGIAGRSLLWPRGKVLGGSSAINGLVYIRGQKRGLRSLAPAGERGLGL